MAEQTTIAVLENCTVRGTEKIIKTDIVNCAIHYVDIENSKVTNCKVYNCTLVNCSIKASELLDTNLHECKFETSKLKGCNITTFPLAFRRFPYEVREMTFKLCVELEDGKTPAFIVALSVRTRTSTLRQSSSSTRAIFFSLTPQWCQVTRISLWRRSQRYWSSRSCRYPLCGFPRNHTNYDNSCEKPEFRMVRSPPCGSFLRKTSAKTIIVQGFHFDNIYNAAKEALQCTGGDGIKTLDVEEVYTRGVNSPNTASLTRMLAQHLGSPTSQDIEEGGSYIWTWQIYPIVTRRYWSGLNEIMGVSPPKGTTWLNCYLLQGDMWSNLLLPRGTLGAAWLSSARRHWRGLRICHKLGRLEDIEI